MACELADVWVDEVVDAHRGSVHLGGAIPARRWRIADQLLLLRVDADHRLSVLDEARDRLVEIAELGVTVGMGRPLLGLGRRLEGVAHLVQQTPDQFGRGLKASSHQLVG